MCQKILSDYCIGLHMEVYDVMKYFPVFYEYVGKDDKEYYAIRRQLLNHSLESVAISRSICIFDQESRTRIYKFFVGLNNVDALQFKIQYGGKQVHMIPETICYTMAVKRNEDDNS